MTDQREQEMQNRIDGLLLEKENLNHEVSYLKEQLAQLKKMAIGNLILLTLKCLKRTGKAS